MQNFNDSIFWLHVVIVACLFISAAIVAFWSDVKAIIFQVYSAIRRCFVCDNFNMQMDFIEYAAMLSSHENPTEELLVKINSGIEEFRKTHEKRCDPVHVARYVKQLYDIHNGKPLSNLFLDIHGALMQAHQTA